MGGGPLVLEVLMGVECGKVLCLVGMIIFSILSLWWVWGIGSAFGKISGEGIRLCWIDSQPFMRAQLIGR